ncbi:PilZ domain-containing protein [bacterium]|nr:PilZ domain-containing protein [bacterium]
MTKTYTGQERRKYPRVEEEWGLLYKASKATEIKSSSTKNISGGGICFEAEGHISPGDVLEIQVNKPIGGGLKATLPIHADAKVIWIKQTETGKYRLGLQFVDMKDKYQKEIIRNVKEQLKIKEERSNGNKPEVPYVQQRRRD